MKEAVITNSKLNSKGFRVLTSGIDLSQFQRNPILLWMHSRPRRGTKDEVLPLGRVENLRLDGDNLIGTPVFDETDEFSKSIKAKWDAGTLKMLSPGLEPIELSDDVAYLLPGQTRSTVTKSKLIEISVADIGSNDDALALMNDGKMVLLSSDADCDFIPQINNQNEIQMKTIFLKLGLTEKATEQEALDKIAELQLSASKVLDLEKTLNQQKEAAITGVVEAAIKNKKITADKKDHFITLGKTAGIEALTTTMDLIPSAVKATDVIDPKSGNPKSYEKLSQLPSSEAEALRKDNKEEYVKLFKAEYGFVPEFE